MDEYVRRNESLVGMVRGGKVSRVVAMISKEWEVDVEKISVEGLRRKREALCKKMLRMRWKGGMVRPAGYMYLDRDVAKACVRFRIKFGPDRKSLSRRGVVAGVTCWFCSAEVEDAEHLLFYCVKKAFITHKIWSFRGIDNVLADGADWLFVEKVLLEVYE